MHLYAYKLKHTRTIIVPVTLYWCETLYFLSMEGHNLRACEDKVVDLKERKKDGENYKLRALPNSSLNLIHVAK
jgi:hypothetical protein